MRYIWDNDLHIHSYQSTCSKDPAQTPERILQYAQDHNLKTIVLTDHCWNHKAMLSEEWWQNPHPKHEKRSMWYKKQDLAHVRESLPLPQAAGVEFLFGVETEMYVSGLIGLNEEDFDALDFIVIPTTHFHMTAFAISEEDAATPEGRAKAWIDRLERLLQMDLPFRKIGIAHLACTLIAPTREEYLKVLQLLPADKMAALFRKAALLGVGIELNASDMDFAPEEADTVLRMFRIAKEQGCKFYMGSDAHDTKDLDCVKAIFERTIDLLELTEDHKFHIGK